METLHDEDLVGVPRRDVRGRTLDDALQHDRRVRERVLRRARQVTSGIQYCDSSRRMGLKLARLSWSPARKFGTSLLPRTAEQFLLFLLGLCCFGVPLFYIGSILLALGVAGSTLGLTLWFLATVTRAVLAWYLRYLIPW